jgi:hypothetical protein
MHGICPHRHTMPTRGHLPTCEIVSACSLLARRAHLLGDCEQNGTLYISARGQFSAISLTLNCGLWVEPASTDPRHGRRWDSNP